jgi:hypothetical protein
MLTRNNLLRLLAVFVAFTMFLTACDALPPDLELPTQEPGPEEPAPTEPPVEPEPTQPPPEPEPTTPPAEPQPTTPPPPEPEPEPPAPGEQPSLDIGRLLLWGAALAVVVGIVIGVIIYLVGGRGAEEAPEVPSVPITTLAADIKEGRVSKIVVSGEDLIITRTDGLTLASHKEPTADLVQLLTNLGVTPEMMSTIIIEVEAPETPTG